MPLDLDRSLIAAAKGDPAALERLIAAVWPEAYRVAWTVLRDRGFAEDAAQEACASIARSLRNLKDDRAFAAWAYKIVVSKAIGAARRPQLQPLAEQHDRAVSPDHTDALDLSNALGALTPVQRATVLLHYYAGFNSSEIAAAMALPASTVRFHLMLARRALRAALSDTHDARATSTETIADVR